MKKLQKTVYFFLLGLGISVNLTFAQSDPFVLSSTDLLKGASNGVSWADYNNDGYQDLFISNGSGQAPANYNWLLLNNGDGTFTRQENSGDISTDEIVSAGICWGDYDNDGDPDLFVANAYTGEGIPLLLNQNSLYENNNDNTFTSVTAGDLIVENDTSGATASWADYNNDGWIDLAISTAKITWGGSIGANDNALYLNNQDGTFTRQYTTFSGDATTQAGLSWVDYDKDGDMDIVTASGIEEFKTHLWTNTGSDFDSVTILDNTPSKGCSWGDYDNDGDFDLFIANGQDDQSNIYANKLFRNDNGSLISVSAGELTSDVENSTASAWADYDNDGDLDIFVGTTGTDTDGHMSHLYRNDGNGSFTKVTGTVVEDSSNYCKCAAWADIDNDGDLDLVIGRDGQNRLYVNQVGNTNNFLNVQLTGVQANKSAIGSVVRVKATINGSAIWLMRDVNTQTGAASHNSLRIHFGLGNASIVDSLVIDWAGSGNRDIYTNITVNQFMQITEKEASGFVTRDDILPSQFKLSQNFPNPFNPSTTIRYQLSEDAKIKLAVYNRLGQIVRILVNRSQSAGNYSVTFNARGLASGVYLYKLQTSNGFEQIRKMILLK